MKHIKSFRKSESATLFHSIIIQKLFLNVLVLGYGCFAMGLVVSAADERSPAWQEAFAFVDKGDRKKAVSKLEALLETDLSAAAAFEVHHVLGYNYEKLRNRPKAIGHYARVASQSYPLADCAIYRLAGLYETMKNRPRAIKWYTALVTDYPESFYVADAKWALAELQLEEKAYEAARTQAVELMGNPRYAREAAFVVSRCNQALGDVSGAFEGYRQLIKEKQSGTVATQARSRLKALARAHKELKLTVADRVNCGLVSFAGRQWKAAVADLESIPRLSDSKLQGRVLYLIGQSYQGRKWYNTAIKKFDAVIALGDKSDYLTRATYQAAQCYRRKGHVRTAISKLESFVKKYAWSELVDDALYDIAQLREKQGKLELALAAYSRLVEVSPESRYADAALWRMGWQHFDAERYEKSYQVFKELKENFPGNRYAMGAHFWMAKIRERQDQETVAREIYKEVATSRYWYYSARAKAILGMATSELEPKAVQDSALPERQPQPAQVPLLMGLRLYEDAISQLNKHLNTAELPATESFYSLIACYEGLAMYDKARELTVRSLESPAFANATREGLEKLRRKLYPRYYSETVEKYAKLYDVDTFLIHAMILEESRYNAGAVSWAGAIGLMQIMPATGKELAQQAKIRRFRSSMLKQPTVNIQLGTKYIKYLNSLFDGDPMLVTGAYNGGPGRMKRWVTSKNIADIDEFVEKITIRETRLHIKKVIDAYDHYIETYQDPREPRAVQAGEETAEKPLEGF